jgi:(2R)-ethylmalonyl-CoA mutase
VTTGEWADTLRRVFGEYRPPTGVEGQRLYVDSDRVADVRRRAEEFVRRTGHRPRIVVGKPGLDGHSNGAEVIAVAARHCGFDVVYSGIRLTPEEIVQSAIEEAADVIGLSILSGSHLDLTRQVIEGLRAAGAGDAIPVIVGGIIPKDDHEALRALGARQIFTPADFDLADVMSRIMDVVEEQAGVKAR